MSTDPTAAEIEAGARAILRANLDAAPDPWTATEQVLAAVLPDHDARVRAEHEQALREAGWQPEEAQWERVSRETGNINRARAEERARVAEEIARHLEERGDRSTGIPPFRAAEIARQHATTREDP